MKRILIITIIALSITGIISFFLFSKPNLELLSFIPAINTRYTTGTISIKTINSTATVELDDKPIGETPLVIENADLGTHKIKLSRISEQENAFYQDAIFYLSVEPKTESVLNIEIGPNGFISGYVLYYEDIKTEKGKGTISVNSSPDSIEIKLYGETMGSSPYYSTALEKGEYTIKFIKDKYESLEFPINIEEGYNLNITTYLFPIPINIQEL